MDSSLNFAKNLAHDTGVMLLDYFHRSKIKVEYKPDHSIVTEADIAADTKISDAIKENFPEDTILSEELKPNTSFSLDSKPIWIVDPVDGTTNFSLGLHHWGVSLVRVENGAPSLVVQYFPVVNEMYTAQKGKGAYINDKRMHVTIPSPDNRTTFFSCCSRTIRRYNLSIPYKTRVFGSTAYSMCSLAHGNALISFEAKTKIWDFAGAWLMIPEAGGFIELFDHNKPFPLQPGKEYAKKNHAVLAAATPELLEYARGKIIPKEKVDKNID